jgi:hypothetical protein
LKNKHKVSLISLVLAIIISVFIGFYTFGNKGFNLSASIEETRFIFLSSKRESVIYDIYKKVNQFQVEVETLSEVEKYQDRATEAKEFKRISENLSIDLSEILKEYDLKLLNFAVSDELSLSAQEYNKNDTFLIEQQNKTTEYLDLEVQLNTYLMVKSQIIDCHTSIDTDVESLKASNLYKVCSERQSVINVPFRELLSSTVKYEDLLSSYLEKSIELHKQLDGKNVEIVEKLQKEIRDIYMEMQEENENSNNEIVSVLSKSYFDISNIELDK